MALVVTEEDRYLKTPPLIFTCSSLAIGSLQVCLHRLELLSQNAGAKEPELLKKRPGSGGLVCSLSYHPVPKVSS